MHRKEDARDVRLAKKRLAAIEKNPRKLVSGKDLEKALAALEKGGRLYQAAPPKKLTKKMIDDEMKRLREDMQDRVCGAMQRRGWSVGGLKVSIAAIERIMYGNQDASFADMAAVSILLNTHWTMIGAMIVQPVQIPQKPNGER